MRLVSLLITLLIIAFLTLQMMGGSGHNKAEENNAKVAEDKARAVEATILKSAQAQDHTLNSAEGGPNNPSLSSLNQQAQLIQQGQQVQGTQPVENGQQQNP